MAGHDASLMRLAGEALGLLATAALMCLFGAWLRDAHALEGVRSDYHRAAQDYLELDREMERLQEHYPSFVAARQEALGREEHRLNWIALLKELAGKTRLLSMQFQIGSERIWNPKGNLPEMLVVSDMQLHIGALHEGDLISFLHALHDYPHARLRMDECDLRMVGEDVQLDAPQVNITAACRLQWLNLALDGESAQ